MEQLQAIEQLDAPTASHVHFWERRGATLQLCLVCRVWRSIWQRDPLPAETVAEIEERAAIREFEGGADRKTAEAEAAAEWLALPAGLELSNYDTPKKGIN